MKNNPPQAAWLIAVTLLAVLGFGACAAAALLATHHAQPSVPYITPGVAPGAPQTQR